jgi:protein subunit release factor A
MTLTKSLFTPDEIQDLKEEYVEFQINEMTSEEMADYIRDAELKKVNPLSEDQLRNEIDEYDEYLYEILANYVKDEEDSYNALLEFQHDRQQNIYFD